MGSSATRVLAAMLLCVVLAGCSGTATRDPAGGAVATTLPTPEIVAAIPNAAQAESRVGPFDVIEVSVYRVDELNRTVQVNASGQITLPLIGTVQAGGKTVPELERVIADRLEERYLQSPQVSVFVKEAVSQRVTVEGAVASPGMVELVGPTTLLQTIALSGGLGESADPRGVVVFRTVQQQRMVAALSSTQQTRQARNGLITDHALLSSSSALTSSSVGGDQPRSARWLKARPLPFISASSVSRTSLARAT